MTPGRHTPATIQVVTTTAAVLAVAVAVATGWGTAPWWAVPLLAAGVAAAEVAVVQLRFGRFGWSFSLTEAVLGAALVCGAGGWAVVAVAAGVAVAQRVRRQPGIKLRYNVAQFALATACAGAVATAVGGGAMEGAVAGLGAFFVVNHTLVSVVLCLTGSASPRALVLSTTPLSFLHTAANSSIGLLGAHLVRTDPIGLLGLVVPLGLLWVSYDQQARRSGEARLYAELARGQERAAARSTDVSAQVVLAAAARLFGGAVVEMVMLAAEGPVRYAADEAGAVRRLRVDQDAFDEPWVLRALGGGRVTAGSEDGAPWCAAVLGEPDAPQAVLIARRSRGAHAFGRHEQGLAHVLVRQAETWLSVADLSARRLAAEEQVAVAGGAARALGDLGARTTPALTVLRDSTGRLAHLAQSDAGVDDIVEELHLVERAVASLLGAIALAAEPDLLGAGAALPGLLPTTRPAADWTTTGVLR